jgi:gamma-glutamylaminecyclotransferase
LFVYGTLMRDGSRSGLLNGQRFLGPVRTPPLYELLDLGAYPGMIRARGCGRVVAGELYEVAAALVGLLDKVEGAPELFRLDPVEAEYTRGPVFAYLYQPHPAGIPGYACQRWDNTRCGGVHDA